MIHMRVGNWTLRKTLILGLLKHQEYESQELKLFVDIIRGNLMAHSTHSNLSVLSNDDRGGQYGSKIQGNFTKCSLKGLIIKILIN